METWRECGRGTWAEILSFRAAYLSHEKTAAVPSGREYSTRFDTDVGIERGLVFSGTERNKTIQPFLNFLLLVVRTPSTSSSAAVCVSSAPPLRPHYVQRATYTATRHKNVQTI